MVTLKSSKVKSTYPSNSLLKSCLLPKRIIQMGLKGQKRRMYQRKTNIWHPYLGGNRWLLKQA